MIKAILVVVLLSVFVVGCVSLKPMKGDGCQGQFTPINSDKN